MSAEVWKPDAGTDLQLSERAIARLKAIDVASDAPRLRLAVSGGGCSGFQYIFQLEAQELEEDDTVVRQDGVELVVDALSLPYVIGAVVDYREDLMASAFFVDNPNADTTCGCGESFALKDELLDKMFG